MLDIGTLREEGAFSDELREGERREDGEEYQKFVALANLGKAEETTIEELIDLWKEWHPDDRQYAIDYAKWLQDCGACSFVPGRRGKPTRVVWEVMPFKIVDLVLNEDHEPDVRKKVDLDEFRKRLAGKRIMSWSQDIRPLLSAAAGVAEEDIVLDMRVNEVRKNFARLHEIEEMDVSFSVGR